MTNEQGNFDWRAQEAQFSLVPLSDFYDSSSICRGIATVLHENGLAESAAWELVADVCSLALDGSKTMVPFSPVAVLDNKRSFDVQDLTPDDLALLSSIVSQVTRIDIAARIHDVLWIRRQGNGIEHALAALDHFAQIPLDKAGYRIGLVASWERAVTLARSLGRATSARAQELETYLSQELRTLAAEGDVLALMLSRMMVTQRIAQSQAHAFAVIFEGRATAEQAMGPAAGLQFLECARDWYQVAKLSDRADDMTIALGEAAVDEAVERANGGNPSFMAAAHHLEIAIQQYRRTSHNFRQKRDLEPRLTEIRRLHREYSQRATEEFELIEGRSFDLTEISKAAEASVSGKELLPALLSFITIAPIPSAKQLSDIQRERLAQGSLADLFGRSIVTNGGRIAYKVPPLADHSEEQVVASRVISSHQMFIGGLVQGAIAPALRALSEEHCISKELLYELSLQSPAVPPGREPIFAKGLAAGFEWDFVTSSHLLIPQIENFVRYHLKSWGVATTSIGPDGTESEKTFAPLLDLAKENGVIDEDIELALRATLVDPRGANLRNDLLHGLSEPAAANGAAGIYVWWLVLYLVLAPFWTRSKDEPGMKAPADGGM